MPISFFAAAVHRFALLVACSLTVAATPLANAQDSAPGTWKQYATSFANNTEAPKTTWYNLAWDTRRNRAYAISWEARLFAFDPAVPAWKQLGRFANATDFHNCTITYDPINDRLWVSDGTGSVERGFRYYDFATNAWTNLGTVGEPSYQAVMVFDANHKRLVAFGGWHASGVRVFDLAPIASAWRSVNVTGGGPTYVSEYQKFTAWRSVLDSKRNRILYVDTDGSLWSLPLDLAAWQRIAVTGAPPPGAKFAYDAAHDTIVGWAPSASLVTGDGGAAVRETWLLPLSTLQWRKAASRASGQAVPPFTSHVEFAIVYDPVRQETIVHTDDGGDQYRKQTWSYRHPAAASPPPR